MEGLVISNMTGNKGPIDNEGTIRSVDTKKLINKKGLVDIEELIVIYYKQQY